MRRFVLLELELTNFQRFDNYKISFSPKETNIIGDNGVGKTTIYSSFTWLLFGKDAYGRKEFDIRRKVGSIDYEADTEVRGLFLLEDGESRKKIELRKVLHGIQDKQNVWRDVTNCYINSVPKLISEYEDYINQLIPEDDFKMLTSVYYFLSKDTAEQRQYLCSMAGMRSAEDIIEENEEMKVAYAQKPDELSLEEFIKSSKDTLKSYKDDKKAVQPSINALIQSKPEEQNWGELQQRKEDVEKEIASINDQLSSLDEAVKAKVEERTRIFVAKSQKEAELKKLKENKEAEKNAANKKAQDAYNEAKARQKSLIQRLSDAQKDHDSATASVESLTAKVGRIDVELNELMKRYNEECEATFALCCPLVEGLLCKEIGGDTRDNMERAYNEKKEARLSAIMEEGRAKKKEYDLVVEQQKVALRNQKSKLVTLKHYQKVMADTDMTEPAKPIIDTSTDETYLAEVKALQEDIKGLKERYDTFDIQRNDEELKAKRESLQKELESIIANLANKQQIERIDNQIAEMREHGKELSESVAYYTNLVETLQNISRAIVDDAAIRINKLFQITHWETSMQMKNGSYKEICKPTVDGISASLNTATRINVGIDICNAISQYKGIQVPLFIDSRESVNQIVKVNTQIINLCVAPTGTPLTIKKL